MAVDRIVAVETSRVDAQRIRRLFKPQTVALVGANEKLATFRNAFSFMNDSLAQIYLVDSRFTEVCGRRCLADLEAIGKPVDAVFALVNAERTVELARKASAMGIGGMVALAGGFREIGGDGQRMEHELRVAAGDMPILGPNCNGYIDFSRRVKLSGAPIMHTLTGPIGLISHSGALMGAVAAAGSDRQVGFSLTVSTGNESSIDMVDCLELMIDDPDIRAIGLIIEGIRRPRAFLAAAERALIENKPIIAMKIGRGERAKEIASSHTGAIAGDAWVYDVIFRQYGIGIAVDPADFLDRMICFAQVPSHRWTPVNGLAVTTTSGGGAGLTSDIFANYEIPLPRLESIELQVKQILPSANVINPLDMTGFVITNISMGGELLRQYENAIEADTVLLQWGTDQSIFAMGKPFLDAYVALAERTKKLLIYGSVTDGRFGEWVLEFPKKGIAVVRGVSATARALEAMALFVRARTRALRPQQVSIEPSQLDSPQSFVASDAGSILTFAETMALLQKFGVEVAPYQVVQSHEELPANLAGHSNGAPGRFAVKLADIPHRTESGAVRLNVEAENVRGAILELRTLAEQRGLPGAVVIQNMVRAEGEAFVGVDANSEFGPLVLGGVGGIHLELSRRVVGWSVPFTRSQVLARLPDLDDTKVFDGFRGSKPWSRDQFVEALMAAGKLAMASAGWLSSLDINPLIWTGEKFIAVDGLCVLKQDVQLS